MLRVLVAKVLDLAAREQLRVLERKHQRYTLEVADCSAEPWIVIAFQCDSKYEMPWFQVKAAMLGASTRETRLTYPDECKRASSSRLEWIDAPRDESDLRYSKPAYGLRRSHWLCWSPTQFGSPGLLGALFGLGLGTYAYLAEMLRSNAYLESEVGMAMEGAAAALAKLRELRASETASAAPARIPVRGSRFYWELCPSLPDDWVDRVNKTASEREKAASQPSS